MIWEYKVVYFGLDAVSPQVIEEDEYEERLYNGAEMLNEMGREGWELVTFLSHTTATNLNKYHAVLKYLTGRPAQQEPLDGAGKLSSLILTGSAGLLSWRRGRLPACPGRESGSKI